MTDESAQTLSGALQKTANDWFEYAYELQVAESAILREAATGHMYLTSPLTESQVAQRKAILAMAQATIRAAKDRALENFRGIMDNPDRKPNG